ncbi:hypothetical protein ACNTMW_33885 [Planosporangium sp. 12N6]|uniref:hypothetical protein n=1 Tax=Planosporangium spinosum TaxID=3402278 RepID=UPI003CE8164E
MRISHRSQREGHHDHPGSRRTVDANSRRTRLPAARAARRWAIIGIIGIAQLMVILDTTIVNIALPSAQRDLGFSTDNRSEW